MARATARILGGFLAVMAVLATSTLVCLHVITAVHIGDTSLRPITTGAASLQALVLTLLLWLAVSHALQIGRVQSTLCTNLIFAFGLLVCAMAAAVSAVVLAHLSMKEAVEAPFQTHLLAASSAAMALATTLQIAFMILQFAYPRKPATDPTEMVGSDRNNRNARVKSIPYAQAKASGEQTAHEMKTVECPPSAMAVPSKRTKLCLFSSFGRILRPSSSKTKLLPTIERRVSSRGSAQREGSVEETSFDSWDTSTVDTHNRLAVLNMSSSPAVKPCGLETIPASPRPSRSPSPGMTAKLEPPRPLRTSRSFSPSTLRQHEDARLTASRSVDELHIHPLFRSDSQTPAPLASPGTSVLASPVAGHVISRRESMQSLARMRSGSLRNPLSHQPSLESTKLKTQVEGRQVDDKDELESAQPERPGSGGDRRMTPPVPAWLLTTGIPPGPDGG